MWAAGNGYNFAGAREWPHEHQIPPAGLEQAVVPEE